ncbi:unnamed protein product [Heligmosomoides polygyrus]|uniref:MmgE/PrpD family protein n=1 Tax=Heligmosomoides polygyrus TaxID=6339 RepID=A0A183GWC7_HELPZ|nr:unnamed protein product [Heligmosomoides polygyrus]
MMSQGVTYHFTRYAVKGLLQVEKGDMHWLPFLAMLLYQKAGGVSDINGATASHEAALIAGKLGNVTNSPIDNSLKDLHAVGKQANRKVEQSAGLPFLFQIGIFVLWRQQSGTFFSATT